MRRFWWSGVLAAVSASILVYAGRPGALAQSALSPAPKVPGQFTTMSAGPPITAVGSLDVDLRHMPPGVPIRRKEAPQVRRRPRPPLQRPAGALDPVAQTWNGSEAMPSPVQNFAGMSLATAGAGWPPDTNGDVGPNHYIQVVNTSIQVFTKDGSSVVGPVPFNAFFTGSGSTPCSGYNMGDPIVLYDRVSGRWIITDFAWVSESGPFYECIAVSKTASPVSGGWWLYELQADDTRLNDYPKLGVWSDGIYMSANMFTNTGANWSYSGVRVWVLNRDDMISGATIRNLLADFNSAYWGFLPVNFLGQAPGGIPGIFAEFDPYSATNQIWLHKTTVNWTAMNASITSVVVPITAADWLPSDIPQPGTARGLDVIDDRLMMQAQYRRIGQTQSLWLSHSAASNGVSGIRWYEIRDPAGTPALYQEGTYQPDANHRWMGALAVDQMGNMAVGYSVSSSSVYPSIRYAGRLATDPLNQLAQGETTLIAGSGSQTNYNRWGDYSSMSIDPADDCTFWYTQEYYATTGSDWQTRIGSFKFPGCGVVVTPTLTALIPNAALAGLGDFSLRVMGSGFAVGATVIWLNDPLTTTYVAVTEIRATVPKAAVAVPGVANVSVQNPGGTPSAPLPFTIVPDCGGAVVTPTVVALQANGGSGTFQVTAAEGCAWTATTASPWLQLTGTTSGNGNGQVPYAVAANYGGLRVGSYTIAGTTVSVTQGGRFGVGTDYTGDGSPDLAVYRPGTGQWIVRNGVTVQWGGPGDIPVIGDFNGNGTADIAVFRRSTAQWLIQGQAPVVLGGPSSIPVPGDYDHDGQTELAAFNPSTGQWMVQGLSPLTWGAAGDLPITGDFDGDGAHDIGYFRQSTGTWSILKSSAAFAPGSALTLVWGSTGDVPVPGDYDRDGLTDVAVYRPRNGTWSAKLSSGAPASYEKAWGGPGDVPVPLDFDGDGRTEAVVYRPSTGTWYALNLTTNAWSALAWGAVGDKPLGRNPGLWRLNPADPDGDRRADLTVFRPSTGGWFTRTSSSGYAGATSATYGVTGDVPVPGDYRGDGLYRRGVFRPSTGQWIFEWGSFSWGATGDRAVPDDYDGDGRLDLAVFRPSAGAWYIRLSSTGFSGMAQHMWGTTGDEPVPGDYDGDGLADVAVFRPATGTWYVRKTSGGTLVLPWGASGDVPVAVDYDGDGVTDLGVFRPSTGAWYYRTSSTGFAGFVAVAYGTNGDVPVPADLDGDGRVEIGVFRPPTGMWYYRSGLSASWGTATDQPVAPRR